MTTPILLDSPERLLDILDRQGRWTEEEYLVLTDHTTRLVEFTDGFLELLPMPTDYHQAIVQFLLYAFDSFLKPLGGKVRIAPLRLRIKKGRFREPDLLLLLSATDRRRQNRFWTGADLIVEVVSPDKPERDLVSKRREYAAAGVAEYWIVNPSTETILVLVLNKKRYRRLGSFARGSVAQSSLLQGFHLDVNQVFDAD
jgi:Uma2 family endonuclease